MTQEEHNAAYPQHAKLRAVKEESQAIGAFLDWLQHEREPRVLLCNQEPGDNFPGIDWTATPVEKLLAEYFGVNLVELENEKERMLDAIRAANKPAKG